MRPACGPRCAYRCFRATAMLTRGHCSSAAFGVTGLLPPTQRQAQVRQGTTRLWAQSFVSHGLGVRSSPAHAWSHHIPILAESPPSIDLIRGSGDTRRRTQEAHKDLARPTLHLAACRSRSWSTARTGHGAAAAASRSVGAAECSPSDRRLVPRRVQGLLRPLQVGPLGWAAAAPEHQSLETEVLQGCAGVMC